MTITPAVPIDRSKIERFRAEAITLRPVDGLVFIVVGVYDVNGQRIEERRFQLTADSTPTLAEYIAACPAAGNLRRQTEQFMAQVDAQQTGTVD